MQTFNLKIKTNQKILALGAELDSSFAFCNNSKVTISENTKEIANNPALLEEKINLFCGQFNLTPDCILTDLNPEYNTIKIGEKLAQKWQIPHIKIQHHIAHIFAIIAEHYLIEKPTQTEMPNQLIGIACDGTGYGTDDTIWGGEIMLVKNQKSKVKSIERIGHLEEQTLIGGQMAVEEPARMLMAILEKFLDEQELYKIINKFYNPKISKLLYSQLKQNFNCQKTTSCARILDAASALLFDCNERKFKHQAAKMLENNSSEPYDDIQPIINNNSILQTTPLFEYLIKNLDKDKKRLASTIHHYIASGLFQIAEKFNPSADGQNSKFKILFSGGMANNKIFREYFEKKEVLLNQKIEPGDPGISLGQIGCFLMSHDAK
ncbi:MAG: hypothetical protein ABIC82_01550 [bacterium]